MRPPCRAPPRAKTIRPPTADVCPPASPPPSLRAQFLDWMEAPVPAKNMTSFMAKYKCVR